MKKGAAPLLISAIFVIAYIIIVGKLLEPEAMDTYNDQVEAFHSLEGQSLDCIIYGSSHPWLGVDSRVLTDKYGIQTYNYGCSWQSWDTTELFFLDSLRTQSPEYAIVDVYMLDSLTWLKDTFPRSEVNYTRQIPLFREKFRYLSGAFTNDRREFVNYFLPFCQYHEGWKGLRVSSLCNGRISLKNEYIKNRGFRPGDAVDKIELTDYREFPQWEIREESIIILDRIIEECDKRGIKLIFIAVPCEGDYWYNDALKEHISDKDCVYIDFWEILDEVGIDGDTDFSDYAHLNSSGAGKVADYLGKYISENYE